MDNTPDYKIKRIPKEFDPRSPSMDFDRTPIMIDDSSFSSPSSQDISFKSVLETSFDSLDMSRNDPSPIVSSLSLEIETSCNLSEESSAEILPTAAAQTVPEDIVATTNLSDIVSDCPVEETASDSLTSVKVNAVHLIEPKPVSSPITPLVAKNIMFSPSENNSRQSNSPLVIQKRSSSFTCHVDEADQENIQQAVKVHSPRTPLASLANQSNSPLNILRAKQWKDFQEERDKLGLAKTENGLPPFKTAPSSVPAKVPQRRRPLF